MRVAFLSSTEGNNGPSNVHKKLVAHWPKDDSLILIRQAPKSLKLIDSVIEGVRSEIVFSGGSDWAELLACRILHGFGKPIACFNHGYVPYENVVNKLGLSNRKMNAYRKHLANADVIVANSKRQMDFVAREQPELAYKLTYVNNAVEPFAQMKHFSSGDDIIRVAVSGGTRPIKGNAVVAKAIKLLNEEGYKSTLSIYGRDYAQDSELSDLLEIPFINLKGQVSREQFLKDLQGIDVFVMNSRHEPFGLSALDAIHAGASVLLSKNCGVLDVLATREEDVIIDTWCAEEIKEKILLLSRKSNASRLYSSLEFSTLNWSSTTALLRKIMVSVVNRLA